MQETFEDPLQKLQFYLSFYTARQVNLTYHVKQLEMNCFRRNDSRCVSEHDAYLLRTAALVRDRDRTQKELEETCRAKRDWAKLALEPGDRDMTIDLWLSLYPQCAKPYVERYVGLMKEEVNMLEEARKTLASSS